MKVIQVYGFGDTGLLLTVGLNKLGLECDLVVSNKQHSGQLPAWSKAYPELEGRVYVQRAEDAKDPFTVSDLGTFINGYDMVQLHQPSGRYADLIKRPFCMWDGGSSRFTFQPSKIDNPPVKADKAASRRAYKKAKVIHANDIDMLYKLFMPKNMDNARFTPLPIDTDLFKPMNVARTDDRFTIYLPSRQENQVKGTYDILHGIRAFVIKLGKEARKDIVVKMPRFGMDASLVPHWLKELGIEDIVEFVPLHTKPDFALALNASDVVVDQLKVGGYGGVGLQAMACGKTVIVNAWRPWYREQLGEVPPILYATTAFDVNAQLFHAYDFWQRQYWQMGKSAREYAVKHHSYMKVCEQVAMSYQ